MLRSLVLKAGAKVQPFFETTKYFFKNIFWSILMNWLPFRKRVQKYNFFLNWQNISTNFFEVFFKWLKISIPLTPEGRTKWEEIGGK